MSALTANQTHRTSVRMAKREPFASELVMTWGESLFGAEWGADVARLANVNPRTVTRIKAAALQGREYPAADGVLKALAEALGEAAKELAAVVRKRDRIRQATPPE